MSGVVHVVDYGVGNLYSVARAIEKVGGEARLCASEAEILSADRLLLPGVGAFRDGMAGLRTAGLEGAIQAYARSGRPLLGICLGMQMLATVSFEFGQHAGLDILPGRVVPIPSQGGEGVPHKVPYIGWASLEPAQVDGFAESALKGIGEDDSVYLVHSYHLEPDDRRDVLATYDYNGVSITAAVARGNTLGCQFHPEKSAETGLAILDHFMAF